MKQALIILKIGALLAIIFASGVWVGRNTAPTGEAEIIAPEPPVLGGVQTLSRQGIFVFNKYIRALELSPEQQALILPLFQEAEENMAQMPRFSEGRQKTMEDLHDRMAPFLSEQQKAESEKIREAGIKTIEKARRDNQ